jgi:uncharacterized protein YdaU (DUF1376 family)
MSGPDIWMPLYVGDYLRDTMHLTTEQHGAYLLLIIVCWTRGGSLPGDDRQLAKITGLSLKAWRAQKEVLGRFFTQADGCWKHGRVTRELERTASLRESRTRAAREGAKSRFATIDPQKSASFPELGGSKTIANPIANGQQNDSYSPSPSPSPI